MATKVYDDKHGFQVWAEYDKDAAIWELFASEECNDYLGHFAERLVEAREIAWQLADERRRYR